MKAAAARLLAALAALTACAQPVELLVPRLEGARTVLVIVETDEGAVAWVSGDLDSALTVLGTKRTVWVQQYLAAPESLRFEVGRTVPLVRGPGPAVVPLPTPDSVSRFVDGRASAEAADELLPFGVEQPCFSPGRTRPLRARDEDGTRSRAPLVGLLTLERGQVLAYGPSRQYQLLTPGPAEQDVAMEPIWVGARDSRMSYVVTAPEPTRLSVLTASVSGPSRPREAAWEHYRLSPASGWTLEAKATVGTGPCRANGHPIAAVARAPGELWVMAVTGELQLITPDRCVLMDPGTGVGSEDGGALVRAKDGSLVGADGVSSRLLVVAPGDPSVQRIGNLPLGDRVVPSGLLARDDGTVLAALTPSPAMTLAPGEPVFILGRPPFASRDWTVLPTRARWPRRDSDDPYYPTVRRLRAMTSTPDGFVAVGNPARPLRVVYGRETAGGPELIFCPAEPQFDELFSSIFDARWLQGELVVAGAPLPGRQPTGVGLVSVPPVDW